MTKAIKLFTDSAADVPREYIEKYDIGVVPLSVIFNGVEFKDKVNLSTEEFYHKLSTEPELPSTNQVNPNEFAEAFKPYVEKGIPILYIGISLKLSGTVQSAQIAKDLLDGEDITIFDTRSASLGEGIQVIRAGQLLADGLPLDDVITALDSHRHESFGMFILDSLTHLVKGGRLSKTQGFVGSLLNIKPLLSFQTSGEIAVIEKVRSQKKALQTLIDRAKEHRDSFADLEVAVVHTNAQETANELTAMVEAQLQPKAAIQAIVGPTIGTHTGPGGVGLFF